MGRRARGRRGARRRNGGAGGKRVEREKRLCRSEKSGKKNFVQITTHHGARGGSARCREARPARRQHTHTHTQRHSDLSLVCLWWRHTFFFFSTSRGRRTLLRGRSISKHPHGPVNSGRREDVPGFRQCSASDQVPGIDALGGDGDGKGGAFGKASREHSLHWQCFFAPAGSARRTHTHSAHTAHTAHTTRTRLPQNGRRRARRGRRDAAAHGRPRRAAGAHAAAAAPRGPAPPPTPGAAVVGGGHGRRAGRADAGGAGVGGAAAEGEGGAAAGHDRDGVQGVLLGERGVGG